MTTADAKDIALYASTGRTLLHFALDIGDVSLRMRGEGPLPEDGQYAWPHPDRRFLYVACSNGSPGNRGDRHCACALRIADDGTPRPYGRVIPLRWRPVHITGDPQGKHVLIAYNDPSALTVHRMGADGALADEVLQETPPDAGIFAHQTRLMAGGRVAILVTRGNDATATKPEDPGALKIFDYDDGRLRFMRTIAPRGGVRYGPRHVDFDREERRLFVSLERQNRLQVHRIAGASIDPEPFADVATLAAPDDLRPAQRAGTLHVHPDGHCLYVANRADGTVAARGRRVFAGGENNIAVYDIADAGAAPRLVQHADTRGIVPRTFALDPSGSVLVAANSKSLLVDDGNTVERVPAGLTLFTVASDGRLSYARQHPIEVGEGTLFWMGLSALSA